MTCSKIILNELNEISVVVANIGSADTYQVPQGYFQQFSTNMLLKVKELEAIENVDESNLLSSTLSSLKNNNPFSIPQGYFDDLAEDITVGAKAIEFVNEELENLSPVMINLKNSNVYTAPQDYFDSLPANMLQLAKKQTPVAVIPISFANKLMRFAVAAAIMGIIAISGWWYMQHKTNDIKSTDVAAKVEQEIKKINDDEIELYINTTPINYNTATIVANAATISNDNIKDMIADIPDEELQQYLDEHTSSKESFN